MVTVNSALIGELHRLGMRITRGGDDLEVGGLNWPFPLQKLLRRVRSEAVALSEVEEPIRAELFSGERLEQHAGSLALAQCVTTTSRRVDGCCHVCWTTGRCCLTRIAPLPGPSVRSARSHRRRGRRLTWWRTVYRLGGILRECQSGRRHTPGRPRLRDSGLCGT